MGVFTISHGHVIFGHRFSLALVNGSLADERCALHKCDNPICVRPDHLFEGDRGDNARDMAAKGRAHLQRNPKAFAGSRHWKRQHPEKLRTKPAAPCSNCGELIPPAVRNRGSAKGGRCVACAAYFYRHRVERPRALWGQPSRQRRRSEAWKSDEGTST